MLKVSDRKSSKKLKTILRFIEVPPLGVYIHFPFCKKKCHYCDFYSITNLQKIPNYINFLLLEIHRRSQLLSEQFTINNNAINSIFIGGGTPSLINPQDIEKILSSINKYFVISSDAEITLECNPAASDAKFFAEYATLGINRISIGVQSFIDEELRFLQRLHSAAEARTTIETAKKYFNNISIDLIFGLHGQTFADIQKSLSQAIAFELQHISYYALIYEQGTPLHNDLLSGKVLPISDEESADFYFEISSTLRSNGYEHYEISNFARPGYRCRHNIKYWTSSDTLAFGASAVGMLDGFRYKNVPDVARYFALLNEGNLPDEFCEKLTFDERLTESIFLSLRSLGLNFQHFYEQFGIDLSTILNNEIKILVASNLAEFENKTLKLTPKGYYICDEITLHLLKIIEKANVQNIR